MSTSVLTESHIASGEKPIPFSVGKLKVCISTLAPFVGGAEVAAERLALGLQEAGHTVFLLLGQEGEVLDRFQRAGLRCLVASMSFTDRRHFWRYYRDRRRLRKILQTERPDVLHNNDLPTHQVLAGAALGLGIPRICHHRFPFDGPSFDWFNKFGAEHHVFVSRALMHEMCAASSRLNSSSRAVVYDGLPLPARPTRLQRQEARAALQLPSDRTLITFAGQIIERKGVADLLHAWSRLNPELTRNAELLIIGDDLAGKGAYRAAMEQLARELHSPARFLGFQKNVGQWLLASDISVVPSHVEPLGNATLEAMAYALPVIGGDVGGIPEMIVREETGLLVPPRQPDALAAALSRLLADPALARQYGENGRNRCEQHFSQRAHTEAVLREYDRVLQLRR